MAKRTKQASTTSAKGGRSGREHVGSVRRYLEALEKHKPRRGRKRTPESIKKQLDAIEVKLADATPLQKLKLVQERMDLEKERERLQAANDLSKYEDDFVKDAKAYGEEKGISYAAWRAMGVPAVLLKKAGISRGRRS